MRAVKGIHKKIKNSFKNHYLLVLLGIKNIISMLILYITSDIHFQGYVDTRLGTNRHLLLH